MKRVVGSSVRGSERRKTGGAARPVVAALLVLVLVAGPLSALPAAAAPTNGWLAAQPIETDDTANGFAPQIAVDGYGNAVAVWFQNDGYHNRIWASRYAPTFGWGTAAVIDLNSSYDAAAPQVAFDKRGDAVAVWLQTGGSTTHIWANHYADGYGWGTAAPIESGVFSAGAPQIAADGNGTVVAVWLQSDGARSNAWSCRYSAGSGWGTPVLTTTNPSFGTLQQIAINGNGTAFAAWVQGDPDITRPPTYTRNDIWMSRYTPGSGWENATLIETNTSGPSGTPRAAVDPVGNAVAVFIQYDGSRNNIWANRYAVGSGWGNATLLETDNVSHAYSPQVAVDPSGNAVAVWYQSNGTRNNIWSNRYAAGVGWGNATLVETDNAGDAKDPQVGADSSGNFLAVWHQSDGTRDNVVANRYVAGPGWGTAGLIETNNAGGASFPQVAVDPSGNAFAVWLQFSGAANNVWANRFAAPDFTAPSIVLSSPVSGTVTNASTVWVSGSTEVGAQVSLNGAVVTVGADGRFGLLVALQPGANSLLAQASDAAGNTANATVNITFLDPVPGLEAQLSSAQSDLALAQAALTTAQSGLAAAQAQVASLQAGANATQAALALALGNLTAAQTAVAALEANASATQADLATARANYAAAEGTVVALEVNASVTSALLNASNAQVVVASANLAVAQARIATLEAQSNGTGGGASNAPSSGSSGELTLAVLLAGVGIAVGAVGILTALRAKRQADLKDRDRRSTAHTNEPPPK